MTTAIIITLLIVICIFSIKSYIKKLTHGCCGTGADEEKISDALPTPSEYTHQYTVQIGGMTCKNCAARIQNAFARKGLCATIDLKSGIAIIYANAIVSDLTIRQTVIGLGYTLEKIEKTDRHL